MKTIILSTAAIAALALPLSATAQTNAIGEMKTISLTEAVNAAEKAARGRAVEAELELKNNDLIYEVDLVSNGTVTVAWIDAETGDMVTSDVKRMSGTWNRMFNKDRTQMIERAPYSLGGILTALEQNGAGQATEVELEDEDGSIFYEVTMRTANGTEEFLIDPATGKRLPGELD